MATRFSEPTSFRRTEEPATDSAAGLFTRLLNDVTSLLRNEVALAKSELSAAAVDARRGVGGIAIGGAVALVGVLALVASAILALSKVMEPWLAALVVGAVLGIIGWAMVGAAQKKLSFTGFRMERTQESLRKDAATASRGHV